jgi:glycosyltransferase involved in cell wall biosynthesis
VHVIPHGALTHLARGEVAAPLLAADGPVVLFFGLLRPYKGLEVLLEAWRGVAGAELWIVGMPRMDVAPLRRIAGASVRFDLRFVSDAELRGYLRRADLVVAPYLEAEQSGVLLTALALGKPLLVSDLAGFADVVESGAARAVPRGDPQALREALAELLSDEPQRAALAESALAASRERFAWDSIAQQTLALYRSLLGENARR